MKRLILISAVAFGVLFSCKNHGIEAVTIPPNMVKEDGSMRLTDSFIKKTKEVDTLSDGSKRLH